MMENESIQLEEVGNTETSSPLLSFILDPNASTPDLDSPNAPASGLSFDVILKDTTDKEG